MKIEMSRILKGQKSKCMSDDRNKHVRPRLTISRGSRNHYKKTSPLVPIYVNNFDLI